MSRERSELTLCQCAHSVSVTPATALLYSKGVLWCVSGTAKQKVPSWEKALQILAVSETAVVRVSLADIGSVSGPGRFFCHQPRSCGTVCPLSVRGSRADGANSAGEPDIVGTGFIPHSPASLFPASSCRFYFSECWGSEEMGLQLDSPILMTFSLNIVKKDCLCTEFRQVLTHILASCILYKKK